MADCGVRVL